MEMLLFPSPRNVLSSNSQDLLPALGELVQVKSGHGASGSSWEEEEEEEDEEEEEKAQDAPSAPGGDRR